MSSSSSRSKVVCQGNQFYTISIDALKLRFVDSFKFIPIALEKFPQRFPGLIHGLEVAKG